MKLENEVNPVIVARVKDCIALANDFYGQSFPLPTISFNQRGKIAGSAQLQKNHLKFNPVLLSENVQHFLDDVVPHEVSHLVVYQLYGRVRPHGHEWQTTMKEVFGLVPKSTHSLDVSNVQGKLFDYVCLCGKVQLTVRRHNNVVRGHQSYICKRCGSKLMEHVE